MKLRTSFQSVMKIVPLFLFILYCDMWTREVCAISSNNSPEIIDRVNFLSNNENVEVEKDYESSSEKLPHNSSKNCINSAKENSIEDLKVINASSNSLTILWKDTGEIANYYTIEWYENDKLIGNEGKAVPTFAFNIENLKPCTTYKIRVIPSVPEEPRKYKEINATTCKISPSECLNVKANPLKIEGSLFLNISWEKPTTGQSCIKKYKIVLEAEINGRKHRIEEETEKTDHLVGQVYACTSYAVTIHAVDVDEQPGASVEILAPSTLAKVRMPPRLVNKINVPAFTTTSTMITLNWNVIDEKNNCSVETVKSRCEYIYSLGSGYELKESEKIVTVLEENPRNVTVVVDDLSPYTKYNCRGKVGNVAGYSLSSLFIPDVITQESLPSAPEDFAIANKAEFKFTWNAPQLIPGRLLKYRMTLSWEPMYPMPTACKAYREAVVENIEPNVTAFTWNRGEGFSRYTAHIEALTGAGWGTRSENVTFDSELKGNSDEVTNLRVDLEPCASDSKVLEVKLRWNLPCSLQGELNGFDVQVHGYKDGRKNDTRNILMGIPVTNITNDDEFGMNLGELWPEYHYNFEVAALIHESSRKGAVTSRCLDFPAGIPPIPKNRYMQTISLHPDKIFRTTSSFEILLPLFANSNGDIRYYAIIVARQDSHYEPEERRFNVDDEGWPNISSWKQSMERDFKLPYQVTEPYWSPYPNYILNYGSIKAVKFVVGNDITCKDVSLATSNNLYCNGPLSPDTRYEIRMRAFTSGGYSDSPPIFVETKAEISAILIVGIVLGLLVLGMILSMIIAGKIYFRRKEKNVKSVDEDTDQGSQPNRRRTFNSLPGYSQESSSRVRRP